MKITDEYPMLTIVVTDLLDRVKRSDAYKGRVWYNPTTWRKPEAPRWRICTEIERGLRDYGQPSSGLGPRMGEVFLDLGYKSWAFPLNDNRICDGPWGGEVGVRRRQLLQEVHDYLWKMELGTLTPADDKVGKILA